MKYNKVLLIVPPQFGFYHGCRDFHLGVAYLSAVLKQHGIKTKILDMRLGYGASEILNDVLVGSYDLIGITTTTYEYDKTYDIIEQLKRNTKIPIIVGGPHVSAMGQDILHDTQADFAMKGECEYTLLEFCQGKPLTQIFGLIYRHEDKYNDGGVLIVENENRPPIKDLDALPLPDFEGFEQERYLCFPDKKLNITTSRGCPYQCVYCSVRLSMGNKFRGRSPKNVVDEIEHWYKKGWKKFEFTDDCFTFDPERAKQICQLIIERNLNIEWYLYNGIRVDENKTTVELIKLMRNSGCRFIAFGVESGSQKVLNRIKKGITIEAVKQAVDNVKSVGGITVCLNFMVGHPVETMEDFMESYKLARQLNVDGVNFYNVIPYRGTELYKWIEDNKLFLQDPTQFMKDISYWQEEPVFDLPTFSKHDRIVAIRMGHALWKRKLLENKFGKIPGTIGYYLSELPFMEQFGLKFLGGTGFGRKIRGKTNGV